ncbi:MAG TPA: hypothetical protein VGO16_04105 [Pseudonocardiaceae bacterium]|jgi:hypothetical protein|nr:hypothetical protein [Pseudonocardiaceae bacterium]
MVLASREQLRPELRYSLDDAFAVGQKLLSTGVVDTNGVVSNGADGADGKALLRIKVDWVAHAIVVEQGDQVILPMRDGSIHLYQVRRAAAAFLVAFERKRLRARIMLNYRPSERHREEELNQRYGWSTLPAIKQTGTGAGSEVSSRYHPGVSIGYWYSD